MKPSDLRQLVVDLHREKAALRRRHEVVARLARQYDLNNTYQYILAREDEHLSWLLDAISALGGTPAAPGPDQTVSVGKGDEGLRTLASQDAALLDAFVNAWRDRVASITNARHRLMVDLMLGESLEHARLFRQAAGGRLDLLGRRTGGERTGGSVLPSRWVE